MRCSKQGKEFKRDRITWGLLLLLGIAAAALAHTMYHRQTAETATPNDWFAAPVAADFNAEAEEAMMLKMVCLTFDDGPSKNTKDILEILQNYDVPATFFVTAQEVNEPYMPLLADIAAQGHQVALHSATHKYSQIYQSSDAFWQDIKALRAALEPYVDIEKINWLRFPGGSTNTVSHRYGGNGIMKKLIAQAEEKGYEWIDWNVCAEDATSKHPNAGQILRNVKKEAEGRDICVVLLHDTKATGETVKALPEMIEWFQNEGYHFCTVAQMYEQHGG